MALFRKHGKWFIDYYFEGRRVRECIGRNKREAEHALAVRKSEVLQGKYKFNKVNKSPLFKDFAEEYMGFAKVNKKSWKRDQTSVGHLIDYFGSKHLIEITAWQIENYKTERREKLTPAGTNRELACLKYMFSLAIKWGKAEKNPVKEVKLFREKNEAMRTLSYEEERELINCASSHIKPIIITALNTGMRIGEVLNLTWDRVDLDYGIITVDNTKGGEVRAIPVNSCLTDVLKNVKTFAKSKYLFAKEDGTRYKSIRKAFNTAKRKADIENLRIHDLRHTFASRLVMSGVDLVTVKELLGHKSINMTMRYAHPTPKHKKIAVELLVNPVEYGHLLDTKRENKISEKVEQTLPKSIGEIAQSVERRTENPGVPSSILGLATR